MKFTLATLALAGAAAAQVDAVPSCAKDCIDAAIVDHGCAATDYACACAQMEEIAASASPCVIGACSSDDIRTCCPTS